MNEQNLFAYLNDHLAGSVGALELLDHMRESAQEDDFRLFCSALYAEIESDQMVLKDVISKLGASEGTIKKVGAWLMEKGSWTEMMLAGLKGLTRVDPVGGHSCGTVAVACPDTLRGNRCALWPAG